MASQSFSVYQCSVCGYAYDEAREGKRWNDLPQDWTCPVCGSAKSQFRLVTAEAGGTMRGLSGRALQAHRVFGYVFLAIYLVLMWQMVPRLWAYQIEFPARTVVHISLGMAVGAVLILKIIIVRFFRRLDASLVPMLGTSLVVSSVVLIGISVPSAFAEAFATKRLLTEDNRQRVHLLLTQLGLEESQCARLASPQSLWAGQQVLRRQCTGCHDLRTVLARPRTPQNWLQTVRRMAGRTTLLNPLDEDQQLQVTAYLVALSPQLQQSAKQGQEQRVQETQARQAAKALAAEGTGSTPYDPSAAKKLFETKCSQCHKPNLVETTPPSSETEARELITRMVEEGLSATKAELAQIVQYLTETYAKPAKK